MTVESGARPSNTLSGELRSRPLAVLLAGACDRGTSGTFTFRHQTRRDVLTMRRGKIAVVRTSEPIAYFGGVLVGLGMIDIPTLDATLHDVAYAKRLHGEVLVEKGAITREQLERGLAEQTFRKVDHLFSLPDDASWSFRDDVDELSHARDEGRPPIETWPAIWRGLRDRPPAAHVQRTIAKVDGGIQVRDLDALAKLGLSPEELAVCTRLNTEPSTLDRVFSTSPLTPERTQLLIYLLALARCLVRIEAAPIGPLELGVAGVRERARRIDHEPPHVMLGLRAEPTAEAVRAAYFRVSRLWALGKLPPEFDEVRAQCIHIYARLAQAQRTLLEAAARKNAEITFVNGGPVGPTLGVAANDSIPPPPTSQVHPTMADVDGALARGDLEAAATIARRLTSAGGDGPAARAVVAWCSLGTDSNTAPAAVEQALTALDRVLTGDPDCVHALRYRALIQKRRGRIDAAVRDYRKLVRLDPKNEDAQRVVRLYDMRVRASSSALGEAESSDLRGNTTHEGVATGTGLLLRLADRVARK